MGDNSLLKDKDGNVSSKRVGGLTAIVYVMLFLGIMTVVGREIADNTTDLLKVLLYTGFGALGIGVMENKMTKNK